MSREKSFFDIDFEAVLFYNDNSMIMEADMADIQSYERVLKANKRTSGRIGNVATVLAILSLLGICFFISLRLKLSPAWVVLVPTLLIAVTLILRKYAQVEHEYSFIAGYFTYSKIYGKSRRKTICEVDIRSLSEVFPHNERTAARLTGDASIINALPNAGAKNPCVCVFEQEEKTVYLLLDCDAQTARIFKHFNPRATDRAILDRLKDTLGAKGIAQEND